MPTPQTAANDVLHFWLEELEPQAHFRRDDAVDDQIRARFGSLHEELSKGVPAVWLETPQTALAAVIVLDQFSRNLFRGDGRAFATDAEALRVARIAVERGDLDRVSDREAYYFIMPYMHAEDVATIEECEALFDQRLPEGNGAKYARLHRDSVAQFGRYPARNEALGRESTPEEIAFLQKNPAGF
ncbi:MAG: DUF924 family protein [Pseudomonadota bacterium]